MKINKLILHCSQLALSLIQKIEDRLRFGNENKQAYFALLSTCAIFAKKNEKMGNRIRTIWALSLMSAILLIGVQGYWLYNQYQHVVNAYSQELAEKILKAGEEEFRLRKNEVKTSYTYIMNKNMKFSSDSLAKEFKGKTLSLYIANEIINEPEIDTLLSEMKQKVIETNELKNIEGTLDGLVKPDELPVILKPEDTDSSKKANEWPLVKKQIGTHEFSGNVSEQDTGKRLASFSLSISPNVSDDNMHKGIDQAITDFKSPFNKELLDSILKADIPELDYIIKLLDSQDSVGATSWNHTGGLFSPHIQVLYFYSPFEYKGVEINAAIPSPSVFKRLAFQLLLSLVLILLLTGCLILQIKTILKQKRINEMREDFVNAMIHELKRPVQTLKTFISFLGNKNMPSDELMTEQVIQDSMFELDNLSAYLKKLKDMIHADNDTTSLQISRFNLMELIEKIIRLVNHPAEKDVKISVSYEMETEWIEADMVHVANIVNNLIENAIKYSSQHVDIEIKAELKRKQLHLTVSDNGIGIPYSEQEKVFAKFYRGSNFSDKNIPGIGLGLSYVKLIAEAHKGKVSLFSDIGKGTSITLCLPQ